MCLAARGADRLTFIGLFISLRIVQDIDLVDWAIIRVFVFVREYLYVGLKQRHADVLKPSTRSQRHSQCRLPWLCLKRQCTPDIPCAIIRACLCQHLPRPPSNGVSMHTVVARVQITMNAFSGDVRRPDKSLSEYLRQL